MFPSDIDEKCYRSLFSIATYNMLNIFHRLKMEAIETYTVGLSGYKNGKNKN